MVLYSLSTAKKSRLPQLVQAAIGVIGKKHNRSLQYIYEQSVLRGAQRIQPTHPLPFNLSASFYHQGRWYRIPKIIPQSVT